MPYSEAENDNEHSLVVPISSDDRLSEVILDAVSEITDHPFTNRDNEALEELESLYESANPESLDRLLAGRATGAKLTFYFADCEIEFTDGTHVSVRRIE